MEANDIIKIYNDYISNQRFKNSIGATGYFVIKKNTQRSSSFTGAYIDYIYSIFYINDNHDVYDFYTIILTLNPNVKDPWNKVSEMLLRYLFNLKDSDLFEQILKGTYNGI